MRKEKGNFYGYPRIGSATIQGKGRGVMFINQFYKEREIRTRFLRFFFVYSH